MILENLGLAISSLKANKMRALLTMLGIIIGIMSVIAIVTIGNAMTASVTSNLSSFGTSNVNVYVRQKSQNSGMFMMPGGGMMVSMSAAPMGGGGRRTQTALSDDDLISKEMIDELKAEFPKDIIGVSYTYSGGSATAKDRERYANIQIMGVNADYLLSNSMTILSGRFISEKDVENNRAVCIVSDKLAAKMFTDGSDPLSQQVKVYKQDRIEIYTIIGVYEYTQTGFGGTESDEDISTSFYIPVSTASRNQLQKNYSQITVVANADTEVIPLTAQITSYFDNVYSNNATWGVSVSSLEEQLNTISNTLGTITLAVSFIAFISLVVGGIGVMNIMLVSVTERTREIGTRKALGAKNFHIRFQFVIEAVIISGIGGIIGIVLGTTVGIIVSIAMSAPVSVSVTVIVFSVAFSMAIGIFFGIYPANKAAKLDPIDALRYE